MSVEKSKGYYGLDDLGQDIKEMRKTLGLSRKELAEKVHIGSRYLANIENSGALPSLPVFYELVRICRLPVKRYFNMDRQEANHSRCQRVADKLSKCPEQYLSIIEAAVNEAIRMGEIENKLKIHNIKKDIAD